MSVRFLLALLLSLSCGILPRRAALVDLLPRDTDMPGWLSSNQTSVHGNKEIEKTDRVYSLYDPDVLATAEYRSLSDSGKTVRVELLKFGSSLDSFGLYSLERGWNDSNRYSGDDDYATVKGFYFRRGRYYVKITGENLGGESASILDQFRAVVLQNLKGRTGEDSLPEEMFLFSEGRSTRDIVYYKKGIPGMPGVKNIHVMRRAIQGKKYNLFFKKLSSTYDAEIEFQNILKSGAGSFILSKIGNLQSAIRIINEKEYLYVSYHKHWIFGVLDAENMKDGETCILILWNEINIRAYVLHNR
ncbi:MAG: hypothetical protein A2W19_05055 [Spirochaetes bacterium RBG_16_49_21]|nr:MAG: hypothetical protein A2W19_05055 [Spirochaetes bacterium RBG_16_49_21]